ncbi:hypothetical protein AB0I72_19710 [Nocardiopsis sp. NPDC049922]|uniref:hypothetical protein n=1 Tax=Nocardiopsis sp. NPDC049922 TaxID=3155157 RepID=UPI0033C23651
MSTHDRFRRLAAAHSSIIMTPDEWTPARVLDIVREQRARETAEGRVDEHMDAHARTIARTIVDTTEVGPDEAVTTLLAMATHVGTVLIAHARPTDSTVLRLLWVVADEIDRSQHQTTDPYCRRCGGTCQILRTGRGRS